MLTKGLQRGLNHAKAAQAALHIKLARSSKTREAAQHALVERLGRLHGLPQKMGQMLSFSWSAEKESAFAPLQNAAEPLPISQVKTLLEKAWKRPLELVVKRISPRGLAASIGQVHRATLVGGAEVAIKVQYPGIREAIYDDLKLLGWLSLPMGGLSRGFDLAGYQKSILDDLERELDYGSELQTQAAMQQHVRGGIRIPVALPEWSRKEVLVTEWIDNEAFDARLARLTRAERSSLGRDLLTFFIRGLLGTGEMQSDWHPGNVRLTDGHDGPCWALFDFGAPCRASKGQRDALRDLFQGTLTENDAWRVLLTLGFDAVWLASMRRKLPELCELLAEPFRSEQAYDLRKWKLSERMALILGDDRWNFRIAAPPQLLSMMRAFHGVMYYLHRLGEPLCFSAIMEETLGRRELAETIPVVAEAETAATRAESLKVRVSRDGVTQVMLSFPASAATRLESLMEGELAEKIMQRGVDLPAISSSDHAREARLGSLFSLHDDGRLIEVWLA